MDNLRDALVKFRNISLEINICLNNEEYDELNYLLDNREKIIDFIKGIEYDKSQFVNMCKEFKIVELQKKLDIDISKKQRELKSNIDKITVGKTANKSYTNSLQTQAAFFNKKI